MDGFFFQAIDGIRNTSVTGVQTCALPISRRADVPVITFSNDVSVARPGVYLIGLAPSGAVARVVIGRASCRESGWLGFGRGSGIAVTFARIFLFGRRSAIGRGTHYVGATD